MNNVIIDKVKVALMNTLNIDSNYRIGIECKLKEDLGLDSMSSLTFLMALEDSIDGFVVDPDTLEMDHLSTVGAISTYVLEQIGMNENGSRNKSNEMNGMIYA